ncbi:MAG TPA: TonB-dependent receptor [Bryobacteraceae bacterium]|nr:TonB-dependent receptor [Bryobacteraceae bacterium]
MPTLRAQTNQGILAGTVLDPSGAAIEGANVTAKDEATGYTLTATSGTGGAFRFPSLPIGLYDITVTHPGFSSLTQTGVNVQISTTTAVTLTLSVGKAEQTITVQADVTKIATETSEVGTVITSTQVVELPLALGGVGAMRSPEAFVFLAPGTTGPGTANSNNGIFISKIGGGQNFGADVLLDGTSILRSENGSSFDEAAPSVEAISEFKVITSSMPAMYGRTTAAVETFTTKSGTNVFHGTAYDILQNEDLNANSWFNNAFAAQCPPGSGNAGCRSQYVRPSDKKNDYGGNLGGPVLIPKLYNGRNRSFFFFNWEQYNQHIGGVSTTIVPTNAQRTGDFSGILNTSVNLGTNPCTGAPVFQGQIFDPNTTTSGPNGLPCRTPFPNNVIPASRISKVSQNFLGLIPAPNASLPNGRNYVLGSSTPLQNTTYTIRIDHSISDKSKIFGTYDTRDNARYTAGFYNLPPPLDSNGWEQNFVTHYGRAGWDYIITPAILNHLALGYNRTNSQNYSDGALQGINKTVNWNAKFGISGISGVNFPITNLGEGVPQLSASNNDNEVDNGERLIDTLTWIKGKHNFSFGFDFRNQNFGRLGGNNDSGTYNFARAQTAVDQALNGTSGNSIASFLLGALNTGTAFIPAHTPRWISQYYATFLQDDWKATSHLTLNLGLRWEVDVPRRESYNDTSNFNPTIPNPAANNIPGALQFGNLCNGCDARWATTKYHDVGPRIGFAYNPNGGRLVIRGGYGVLYSPLQYTDFGGNQIQGYAGTPTFNSSDNLSPAFNWDNGFPPSPPPPFTNPSAVNKGNPNWIQPRFGQPGIIQSWSFQIQEQVSKDMVATVGYVGNRAQNLRSAIMNWNNIPVQNLNLGPVLNQPVTNNTLHVTAPYPGFFTDWGSNAPVWRAIRPYPQYDFIYMDVLQNIGQSTYESLQATLERHLSAGLSLQASFTWAKTLTDADSILPGTNGGISQVQNIANLTQEKSWSSQDVPFTFTTSFLYQLPFGKGKPLLTHGIAGTVLGGWTIGAVLRYQDGVPISFGCANGIPGWQNCIRFNRQSAPPLNPAVTNGTFNPFTQNFFSPVCSYLGQAGCAFADPNTELIAAGSTTTIQQARGGAYFFGDYPRNNGDARTPNYYNEDLSVLRNFAMYERFTLQLKGEFLNAFNRHIFSAPNASPYASTFGQVTGTIDAARIIQFTMRLTF